MTTTDLRLMLAMGQVLLGIDLPWSDEELRQIETDRGVEREVERRRENA